MSLIIFDRSVPTKFLVLVEAAFPAEMLLSFAFMREHGVVMNLSKNRIHFEGTCDTSYVDLHYVNDVGGRASETVSAHASINRIWDRVANYPDSTRAGSGAERVFAGNSSIKCGDVGTDNVAYQQQTQAVYNGENAECNGEESDFKSTASESDD